MPARNPKISKTDSLSSPYILTRFLAERRRVIDFCVCVYRKGLLRFIKRIQAAEVHACTNVTQVWERGLKTSLYRVEKRDRPPPLRVAGYILAQKR